MFSIACWLVASCVATAADRFVATNGQNNTNPGRGLSVGSPYLTIDYAADQAEPGDTIYIRGGTYRETVSPTVSGTSESPIVFKPYNNETVIITGLNLITPGSGGAGSWAVDSGSIYRIQLTANHGSDSGWSKDRITGCQVFVNGEPMSEARWPNSPTPMGINRTEAATAISGSYTPVGSPGSYVYDALYRHAGLDDFAPDVWKDGIIVFAPGAQWYRRVAFVTGNTPSGAGSEVRFSFNPYNESPNREDTDIGDPFFLMGRKVALDAEKEFFFDTLEGASTSVGRDGPRHMLYLRMPGSVSPAGHTVEMRRRQNAINLTGVSHLRFEDLRIVGGRIKTTSTTSDCVFSGLDVDYASYTWGEELGNNYDSVIIEGTDHRILDSSLANSTNRGIFFPTGGGHLVRNTVIRNCFLSGIEMKNTTSNIRVENVTVYNLAGAGISAEARPNQVLHSHGYQSALFTTDIGLLNALDVGDGLNSEWAYNWMHGALGSVNSARDWYGSPAIRLDAGTPGDGPSNFFIHHNIAWNTTQPEKTIAIWALRNDQVNYQDAKIRLYNNSVDKQIGFTETASTPASLKGMELTNNLTGVGMNIFSSGTDATGKLYLSDLVLRNNLFNNTSIPNNPVPPHSANRQGATGWTAPASPPYGYQLSPSSQAIDNGTTIAGITDGYVGTAPDIGALEAGLKPFTPGAKVRLQDLAGLTVTPTLISNSVKFVVTGLPVGRSLPDDFRLKVGSNFASSDFSQQFDFVNHTVTATFNALSAPGSGQSVQASLDGINFITLPAAITVPGSTLAATNTNLTSDTNPATAGGPVTLTATVASASGTPTGTVTFLNGTSSLGTGTLSGGVATLTTSSLGLGLHSITASYPTNATHAASNSAIVLQSILGSEPPPAGIVRANFTDGNGSTTAQQFPGAPGDGWLAGWTNPLGAATVLPSVPLGTGGNFLSVTRDSTTGSGNTNQAGASRQWSSAVRPYNQFSRTTFDFRIDSTTPFDSSGDAYTIAMSNVTGTIPAGNSTVYLRCFGASPGIGFEGTAIQAREWCVFNGVPGTGDAYSVNKFRRTGMIAVPGTTYSFTIDTYGADAAGTASGKTHGTYDVTISNGTTSVTVAGSGFRSAAFHTGGYLSFASQQNNSTDNLSFSVDSIEMTPLTILEPTTTTVTSNNHPANPGEAVTFTATVTSGTGTPTGTVTFFNGAANLGFGTLNGSGVAALSTSALTGGNHSITATYAGNPTYAASNSTSLAQVVRFTTTTDLTSSTNPANPGESIIFTATVTGGNTGDTVNFFDGPFNVGSGTLNGSGVATFSTSALPSGNHMITATFAATPTDAANTSEPLAQIIRFTTTIDLTSNPNPANPSESVTFTATVFGGNEGDPVDFFDGATHLGSGTLTGSGVATFSTLALASGNHSITATFAATATYAASTSAPLAQFIRSTTTTALTSSATPADPGDSVTFTATVTGGNEGDTVDFLDGVISIGTGTITDGTATFTTSNLAAGSHSITAYYAVTPTAAASTSAPLAQVIRSATATSLTSISNPADLGEPVTFTATVTGGNPGDTVNFFNGVTNIGSGTLDSGIATLATSSLTAGSHPITASYAVTPTTAASTSSELIQTITALSPYENWLADHFSSMDLGNPALESTVWGILADPDGDTLVNLLEYALELSPVLSNPLPAGLHATGLPLSLTFKRARAELDYTVQASESLTTWQDLATNPFPVGSSGTVTDTASPTEPRRNLRLKITQP